MKYYIALGSNKGNREGYLKSALEALRQLGGIKTCSPVYETRPIGPAGQRPYLNALCVFNTALRPFRLLRKLKQIETQIGRTKNKRWAAREIDLDIVDWDGERIESAVLGIPHRMMCERAFVLAPLQDVQPDYSDRAGNSIAELLANLTQQKITFYKKYPGRKL